MLVVLSVDSTSDQLTEQEQQQRVNHEQILEDLANIRDRARDVWTKIGKQA